MCSTYIKHNHTSYPAQDRRILMLNGYDCQWADRAKNALRTRPWFILAILLLLPIVTSCAWSTSVPAQTSSEESDYVVVQNGHLSLHGNRVRFWGAIGGFPGKTYADNEAVVQRLSRMGFNEVRDWNGFPGDSRYQKGDGSLADRTDHFLYVLKKAGFHVWCAGLNRVGSVHASDVGVINDPASEEAWKRAVGPQMSLGHNLARAWDPRFEAIGIARMKAIADHFNPYTGMRWADDPLFAVWELSNEEWWFVHMTWGEAEKLPLFFQQELQDQWNRFLRRKYGNEGRLSSAWLALLPGESLERGTILLLPLRASREADTEAAALGVGIQAPGKQKLGADRFNRTRGGDVIEFLTDLWIQHKQHEADAMKSWGKSLRASPLVWDTGIGYDMPTQFMQQHADAIAHDTYITGFHHDRSHRRFPWFSGLEELPRLAWDHPWVEQNRYEGKPFLVYETQIEQPAKYRAEYPMRVASLGAIQDWDAVNWHYFGPTPDSSVAHPYERPLDITIAGGHPQGYHYQYDEVQMSAMRAASEIFKQGLLKPAPTPTQFIFGRRSLYNLEMTEYGEAGSLFMPTTYRWGMRLRIDPSRENDEVIGPVVKPRVYEASPIRPTDEICYDWQHGFLLFDSASVTSFTGFLENRDSAVTFRNGVQLRDVKISNPPGIAYPVGPDDNYLEFTLVSLDGQPLETTRHALISAVSTSFNTGFRLDESKIKREFEWAANPGATSSVGILPVLVARVGFHLQAPFLSGMTYTMLNWNWEVVGSGKISDGTLAISSDVPVFLIFLER
jgi:hypothetical protein